MQISLAVLPAPVAQGFSLVLVIKRANLLADAPHIPPPSGTRIVLHQLSAPQRLSARARSACVSWHALRHTETSIAVRKTQNRERKAEMFEQHLGRSVTIDQAATLLQVSRRTIYNRIRDGKLQTIRTIGGSQRVLVSSLDDNKRPSWTGIKFDSTPGDTTPES